MICTLARLRNEEQVKPWVYEPPELGSLRTSISDAAVGSTDRADINIVLLEKKKLSALADDFRTFVAGEDQKAVLTLIPGALGYYNNYLRERLPAANGGLPSGSSASQVHKQASCALSRALGLYSNQKKIP